MAVAVEKLAAAVASGEPDQVDAAIELATADEPRERFGWFDDLLEAGQEVFADGDGTVRRSVVRLLRETYPGLEVELGTAEREQIDGITLEVTAEQRHRYVEFLLEALADEDEGVREAAAESFDLLATRLAAADLAVEQEALHDALSELAVQQSEAKRQHTERALRMVGRPEMDAVLADVQRRLEE